MAAERKGPEKRRFRRLETNIKAKVRPIPPEPGEEKPASKAQAKAPAEEAKSKPADADAEGGKKPADEAKADDAEAGDGKGDADSKKDEAAAESDGETKDGDAEKADSDAEKDDSDAEKDDSEAKKDDSEATKGDSDAKKADADADAKKDDSDAEATRDEKPAKPSGPPEPIDLEEYEVTIVNLGPEGAFVRTDKLLPVQTKVNLGFKLDSYPREIDVVATILWARRGEGAHGMGMHFTRIPLFEKNVIIDYILRRYAEFHSGRP